MLNIRSSTATVFKADGTVEYFAACTYPSDVDKYPTIPEGIYEAKVGIHKGRRTQYIALRLSDVGTINFNNNKIQLGFRNPAHPNRDYAEGINIHKPGLGNATRSRDGSPISEGCLLIDRNSWEKFMSIFNNSSQVNNIIGVIVSRTYSSPTIIDNTKKLLPSNSKNDNNNDVQSTTTYGSTPYFK